MAEQVDLSQSVPATTHWRVHFITLLRGLTNVGSVAPDPSSSRITVALVGDHGRALSHTWTGSVANDDIIALNKANLTNNSLEKRILNRLILDGVIAGTVSGSPD